MEDQWDHRMALVNGINIHYVLEGQGNPVVPATVPQISRARSGTLSDPITETAGSVIMSP